jgi:ribosomal protein L40E
MAKKTKGYVELYWRCANCGSENLGSNRFCTSCGNPQPQNVDFHQGSKQQLLKDAEKLKQAKAGADIYCGFCGTRNPATASKCSQCGSDLRQGAKRGSAGRVVGAFSEGDAETIKCANCGTLNPGARLKCQNCGASLKHGEPRKQEKAAAPAAAPLNRTALAIGAAMVLVLCVAIYFLFIRTQEVTGVVVAANWQRSVAIEAYGPVELEAWRDEVPVSASNVSCSEQVSSVESEQPTSGHYEEVCGTPYNVETGGGYAEVVQDCEYHLYEDYCTYTVNAWTPVSTAELQGVGLSPDWPDPALASNQRLGDQAGTYECIFESGGENYVYSTDSFAEFQLCELGSTLKLTINGAGAVVQIEQ